MSSLRRISAKDGISLSNSSLSDASESRKCGDKASEAPEEAKDAAMLLATETNQSNLATWPDGAPLWRCCPKSVPCAFSFPFSPDFL